MLYLTLISLGALLVVGAGAGLLVKALLDDRARAEEAWAAKEQMLLQRIQAPEAAVLQHEQDTRPVSEDGPWQPWDDDTRDPMAAMTKEELAEMVDGSDG